MAHDTVYQRLAGDEGSHKANGTSSYDRYKDPRFLLRTAVPLIALIGLGAHFSKNALAPAQPVLEAMGLSPVLYAIIYDVPTVGAFIFPTLWGFAYEKAERTVILMVPLGLLCGQAVLVSGFISHGQQESGEAISFSCKLMMLVGLIMISLFRAGAEVVQHTLLAKVMSAYTISGFVIIVFCTHFIVVICNVIVPRVLLAGDDPWDGVVMVQILFLIPSVVASAAAFALCAMRLPQLGTGNIEANMERQNSGHLRSIAPDISAAHLSTTDCSDSCGSWVRTCLILWAGAVVGALHAFQSTTSKFIVSRGYSVTTAGDITARNQFIALCVMPLCGAIGTMVEKRWLMVGMSVVTLFTSLALALVERMPLPDLVWKVALFMLAVVGVFAPVLSLSMVPEYMRQPGKAYGVLDSWKSLSQVVLVLLIGKFREMDGFQLATTFLCEIFVVILILAVSAAWRAPARLQARSQQPSPE